MNGQGKEASFSISVISIQLKRTERQLIADR